MHACVHVRVHIHIHTHTHTFSLAHLQTHKHMQILSEMHSNPHPHQNVLEPEAPPLLVVVLLRDASIEDPPAPLVEEVAEGDKGDLVEGHLH